MTIIQKGLAMSVLCLFLMGLPDILRAEPPGQEDVQEMMTLLRENNSKLSDDLRRIQREIAALRADLDKPGMKDVFAGIGYIFGLFGVAAFVASRRKG